MLIDINGETTAIMLALLNHDYDIKKEFQILAGMGGAKAYGREFELPGIAKYNILFKSGLVDSFHKAGMGSGRPKLYLNNCR